LIVQRESMNRFGEIFFACLPVLMIVLLISCSSHVRTASPQMPQDSESNLTPHSAALSEMTWETFQGEVRNYVKTRDIISGIMEEYKVSGISIILTQKKFGRHSPMTYSFYLGVENPHTGKPIDGQTVFQAGRLGQPVFAYFVMRLFSGGWFNVNRPLYKYLPKPLPDYPAYQDLKGDSRYKRLTARLILSHQSGLVNSRLTHPEHRLTFETSPGKSFRYSEEGYRLLQFVLEQRFGRSLNDLAKSFVFDPLSMKDTSFVREPRFEGHFAIANGGGEDLKNLASDVSKTFITNAKDYADFIWPVMMHGGALDWVTCGLYFWPVVSVHSPTIFELPHPGEHPTIPKKLSWCMGWGTYKIPGSQAYFIGDRHQGIECYATIFDSHRTAVSIFVVGNVQRSVTARILREIVGEVETPLKWLGFE